MASDMYVYSGWGWLLWFGVVLFLFSSLGNWGYTYRAHRKFSDFFSDQAALRILNERYARGEVTREEYLLMRKTIASLPISGELAST